MFLQIQPFYGLGNANIPLLGLYFFPFQASGEDVKNINVATESWKNNESENKQGSCSLTNTLPIRKPPACTYVAGSFLPQGDYGGWALRVLPTVTPPHVLPL